MDFPRSTSVVKGCKAEKKVALERQVCVCASLRMPQEQSYWEIEASGAQMVELEVWWRSGLVPHDARGLWLEASLFTGAPWSIRSRR
jgi:hypothetical protein